MIFEEDLWRYLTENATIYALVQNRIYPDNQLPQDVEYPAVTYQCIHKGDPSYTTDGASGLIESRFQFDILAESFKRSKEIAKVIRQQIDGYQGTVGSTYFNLIKWESEQDGYDSQGNISYTILEFYIHYNEL